MHRFADDLDIIENSLEDIANGSRVLERATRKVGLKINTNKTKIMELIDSGIEFKYLAVTLSTRNDWSKEININIYKAEKTFYALTNFLNSKMLSKK